MTRRWIVFWRYDDGENFNLGRLDIVGTRRGSRTRQLVRAADLYNAAFTAQIVR
ncbi:MAG: hypothetical protein M3R70_08360 [Actinomycetota bacterium]|nr:hypothetical protein [Actinomycetota bacterium]